MIIKTDFKYDIRYHNKLIATRKANQTVFIAHSFHSINKLGNNQKFNLIIDSVLQT